MTDPIVQRLLWKEYRVQRGFWLSIAVVALVGQLIVLAVPARYVEHSPWLFGLALACPAFYALGCGATLFAAEREEGTLEQLRVLAAPARKVLVSKVGFGVVSTMALMALLWVLAFGLSGGRMLEPQKHEHFWGLWGVACLDLLAWGLFFSLITRRVLHAACLGGFASVACAFVSTWISDAAYQLYSGRPLDPQNLLGFVPARCLLALFVLGIDIWLGLGWVLTAAARSWHVGPSLTAGITTAGTMTTLSKRIACTVLSAFVGVSSAPVFYATTLFILRHHRLAQRDWLPLAASPWLMGVSVLEAIAWGILFAVLIRSTLWASCLAAVAAFVSCQLVSWSVLAGLHSQTPWIETPWITFNPWLAAIPARLVLASVVLVIDVTLALCRKPQAVTPDEPTTTLRAERATSVNPFYGLIWQEWRQAWRMMAVLGGIALGLALLNHVYASPLVGVETEISWLIVFASPLMGACAFLAEQEGQRFRFFAERGVSPRQVWLAKHVVWLPASLGALAVASGVIVFSWVSVRGRPLGDIWDTALFGYFGLLWAIVAYAAGQLASMLLQRGLLAGVVGLLLSACLAAWQALMATLGVSLWLSVAPVPVVLMLITWLRAPDWMLERHKLGAWLRIAAVLLGSATAMIAGVAAYRVYEIPYRSPGFSLDEFLHPVTAEERATADLHRKATAALQSMRFPTEGDQKDEPLTLGQEGWDKVTAMEREWLDANREAVGIALQAAGGGPCVFHDPRDVRYDTIMDDVQATREFASLIILDARRLESEGQLDAALERYVATLRLAHHTSARGSFIQFRVGSASEAWAYDFMPRWAAHPDQTPERIRHAIQELHALAEHAPPLSDAIKVEYHVLRRLVLSDWSDLASNPDEGMRSFLFWMSDRCMPWERRRALRLLDLLAAGDLDRVESVEHALAEGSAVPRGPTDPQAGPQEIQPAKWRATTFVLQLYYPATEQMVETRLRMETRRRALLVILALKGWQIEHGELPESLDQLAGKNFDRLPLDPYSGGQFGYSRGGFARPLEAGRLYGFSSSHPSFVDPDKPLIWSKAGGSGQIINTPRYDGEGRPVEALDGWPFLIPEIMMQYENK